MIEERDLNGMIAPVLRRGGRVIWLGSPSGSLFTAWDWYAIPFSLVWTGGIIFLAVSAIQAKVYPFAVVAGLMLIFGLYQLFGRFVAKARLRPRTVFAVTNQRVVEKSGDTVRSCELMAIPGMVVRGGTGRGSIGFDIAAGRSTQMFRQTGMAWFSHRSGMAATLPVTFYEIEDSEGVARKVTEAAAALGSTVVPSNVSFFSRERIERGPQPPVTGWLLALQLVAGAGFLLAALLNLLSWFPIDLGALWMLWILGFPLIFIVWGTTIARYRKMGFKSPLNNFWPFLPLPLRLVGAVFVLYVVVNFVGTLVSGALPGQPTQVGNRYYFNNKGQMIRTDRAGYERGERLVARMFTGGEMIFLGLPILVLRYLPPPTE